MATACGALAGGWLADTLQAGWAPVPSYRAVVVLYACIGAALCVLFSRASASVEASASGTAVEAPSVMARFSGLHRSQSVVLRLSALFALDSFAGLGRPLLVGPSRKSFLTLAVGERPPAEREWATAAAVTAAVLGGAHIVRVHRVAEMAQVVKVADAVRNAATGIPEP